MFGQGALATFEPSILLGRIRRGRSQDCASTRQDSGYSIQIERHGDVIHYAPPPFHEAGELVLVVKNALADCRANYGVQSRAVSTASENSHSHSASLLETFRMG